MKIDTLFLIGQLWVIASVFKEGAVGAGMLIIGVVFQILAAILGERK